MDNSKSEEAGLFDYETITHPEMLFILKNEGMKKAEALKQEIYTYNGKRKVIKIYEELMDTLYKIETTAIFIMNIHPQKEFYDAGKKVSRSIAHYVRHFRNREFYKNFKNAIAKDQHEKGPYDDYTIKMISHAFRRSGASSNKKVKAKKMKLNRVDKQIYKIKLNYSKLSFQKKWQQIFFPSMGLKYKETLFHKLLRKRLKFANLKGYPSYAEFILQSSVAKSPDFVQKFLENVSKKLKPKAFENLNEILHVNRIKNCSVRTFDGILHLILKAEENFFSDLELCVKDYFSIDVCMDGLNLIFKSLYDVSLQVIDDGAATTELWHNDIKKYCVREQNEIIGYICCDFFKRPRQLNAHCMYKIQRGRIRDDGTYQKPIVVVSLNLTKPGIGEPVLLNPFMVKGLFHEMGHAMNAILKRPENPFIDVISGNSDFSEIPSTLMEYYASDSRILQKFAKHYKTGEIISNDLVEKIISRGKKFSACWTQVIVLLSAFDQACHNDQFLHHTFRDLLHQVWDLHFDSPNVSLQKKPALHNCTHIVGDYGASYYSYLISPAISSSIWHKYFKDDPLSRVNGEQYRNLFLAQSTYVPLRVLTEQYLHIELTPEYLSDELLKNLDII